MSRAQGRVLAFFAVVLACSTAGRAQQTSYQTRFLEELKRQVPPVTIPAPTAADQAAAPAPKALPLDIAEAKRLMGVDALGPGLAARLPGGKLGIVDLGFRGLKEWLAAHPDEAKLTTYRGSEAELTDAQTPDHGYWVYRVARAVLPDVPIYLYPSSGAGVASVMDPVVMAAARDGVEVFNMSLAAQFDCQLDETKEDEFSRDLRLALVQRETFLFVAAGNARNTTHTWVSSDSNDNGYVDFRTAAEAARHPGTDLDGARVMVGPGDNRFYFSWDARNHPGDDYALELETREGQPLAEARHKPGEPAEACVILDYRADRQMQARLRVKRLAGAKSGTLMRVSAYGQVIPAEMVDFNGLQTALAYEFRQNPFVIFVGGFGKTADGKLVPSPFSDLGRAADGHLVPDVLGPGQLIVDGHEIEGTSFASPFLTALYATRVGYNLKNLVEHTTGFAPFAPGVAAFERSRLGIPDAQKVTQQLVAITGPTKVEKVSHAIEGGDLVIRYTLSRCCMQSLVWYAAVVLLDGTTGAVLKDAAGKPIVASQELRSDIPDQVGTPVVLRIPMSELQGLKGRPLKLYFGVRVRAWPAPPPASIKVDEAPEYRFTL